MTILQRFLNLFRKKEIWVEYDLENMIPYLCLQYFSENWKKGYPSINNIDVDLSSVREYGAVVSAKVTKECKTKYLSFSLGTDGRQFCDDIEFRNRILTNVNNKILEAMS
jgi:hypothetical protein